MLLYLPNCRGCKCGKSDDYLQNNAGNYGIKWSTWRVTVEHGSFCKISHKKSLVKIQKSKFITPSHNYVTKTMDGPIAFKNT